MRDDLSLVAEDATQVCTHLSHTIHLYDLLVTCLAAHRRWPSRAQMPDPRATRTSAHQDNPCLLLLLLLLLVLLFLLLPLLFINIFIIISNNIIATIHLIPIFKSSIFIILLKREVHPPGPGAGRGSGTPGSWHKMYRTGSPLASGCGHFIIGLFWDNRKQNGNYHNGLYRDYRDYIGVISEYSIGII